MSPNDEYYALLKKIEESRSSGDIIQMLQYYEETLPLLKEFTENWIKRDGEFLVNSISPIELGCMFWGITNNKAQV